MCNNFTKPNLFFHKWNNACFFYIFIFLFRKCQLGYYNFLQNGNIYFEGDKCLNFHDFSFSKCYKQAFYYCEFKIMHTKKYYSSSKPMQHVFFSMNLMAKDGVPSKLSGINWSEFVGVLNEILVAFRIGFIFFRVEIWLL